MGNKGKRERYLPLFFVLPTVVIILIVSIFPLIYSFWLSLCEWDIGIGADRVFVGLQNYAQLIRDTRFLNSLINTGRVLLFGVGSQFALGLGLALLLNRSFKGKNLISTLFLLPMMISPVVVGCVWRIIYHHRYGPLNYILSLTGLNPINWLGSTDMAIHSIILTDIWEWTPFMMIVLLAGLQAIPDELFEASRADGANRWQIFSYILIPLLRPVMIIAILIRIMDSFKIFDLVFLITYGGPGQASETVSFYNYLTGFRHFRMGYASSMAYFQLAVIVIIANIFLRVWRRRDET